MHHLDFHGVAREGVAERGHEGADFDTTVDCGDDLTVVATQHASLVGDADLGGPLAEAVHQPRGSLAPVSIVTILPYGSYVVRSRVHRGDDLADLLGRILQVRIERDHVVATGLR